QFMEVVAVRQFAEVFRRGEHGDAMYLVLEGELRARVIVDKRETTLSTMTVGDFLGEISLLDEGPRSADVIANSDSRLLKVSSAAFASVMREAPALAASFLYGLSKSIGARVRILTQKYQDSIHFSRLAGAVHSVPRFINTTTFVASIFGSGEARQGSIPRSGAVTEE